MDIQLSHALDLNHPHEFTSRGNITVHSINSADYTINQKGLTVKERQGLIELAKQGKFYRLKADVVGSDGVKTSFLTSSKACHLIQSQLHDFLTISFYNTAVLGINQKPINIEMTSDDCSDASLENVNEFSTVLTLKNCELAPAPDTSGFIQKMERERESREKGETKDNRSFIQKYWMYIVPAVILLLVSGISNPEAQAAAR